MVRDKSMIRIPIIHTVPARIFMAITLCILLSLPVFSDDKQSDSGKVIEPRKVISIDTLTDLKDTSAETLGFASAYAVRNGNNADQAISLCRKSLLKNNDDIDVHLQYAQLLEGKYREQGEPDPTLYMTCVKEWLLVLRNEAGDEKDMNFHGVGLPFIGFLFKDDDRVILAKSHLIGLTGFGPKGWETDTKYLERVAKHSAVQGKILARDTQNTSL